MKKILIIACVVFLAAVLPVAAISAVYTIDSSRSFVMYGDGFYNPVQSGPIPLSGTFDYVRADDLFGVIDYSSVSLNGIYFPQQSSYLGISKIPTIYYGMFSGSSFGGVNYACPPGYSCVVLGNVPQLIGTFNEQYIEFTATDWGSFGYSYWVELYATAGIPNAVPEPATVLLLGLGLVGAIGVGKKFKK